MWNVGSQESWRWKYRRDCKMDSLFFMKICLRGVSICNSLCGKFNSYFQPFCWTYFQRVKVPFLRLCFCLKFGKNYNQESVSRKKVAWDTFTAYFSTGLFHFQVNKVSLSFSLSHSQLQKKISAAHISLHFELKCSWNWLLFHISNAHECDSPFITN